MSEIITLHVGGSGINLGLSFWDELRKNHQAYQKKQEEDNGSEHIYFQRFFNETQRKQYVPRTIFMDTDCRAEAKLTRSMHNLGSLVTTKNGGSCRNLFAEGYYTEGAEITDQILQLARKEIQKCNVLSGFIMTSSPCGGAGSGLGSLVLSKIRQEYPDRMFEQFKIMPGPDAQNQYKQLNPLQIYNIVLSNHQSIENTDLVYFCENSAVNRTLLKRGNIHPNYSDVNQYMGHFLNQHISSYIEPGNLNTNQRKRATNLIPFPRLKHICGILSDPKAPNYLESGLSDSNKIMLHACPFDKRIFTLNLNVKDSFASENQVTQKFHEWLSVTGNAVVDWIPNGTHISLGRPIQNKKPSALTLINGTHNISWLRKISDLFTPLFRRKAFVSHYTGLGLDQMQMTQAQSNCNDLISQYTPCSCCAMEEDEEFYEEEQGGRGGG